MATKLKNLKLKKVDFVDAGANPEADIMIKKRDEREPEENIFKRFTRWLKGEGMNDEDVEKAATSFAAQMKAASTEAIQNEMWNVTYALRESLSSILMDPDLDSTAKSTAMIESVSQFSTAIGGYVGKWCNGNSAAIGKRNDVAPDIELMKADQAALSEMIESTEDKKGELEEMLKIDKSKMTPEEVTAYDAIVKKYAVEEPEKEPEVTAKIEDVPLETESVEKAAPTDFADTEVAKALKAQIEEMKKSVAAMKDEALTAEMAVVAKKYAPLGKTEDELVPVLKQMKSAGEELYNAYLASMDAQLDIQKQSGVFTEIGKSTSGDSSADPTATWIAKAKELIKSDPTLSMAQAMDKVALEDDELRAQIDQ